MSKKLWGGRFAKKTDPLVEKFSRSIQYDHKLARYDVLGSIEHVRILKSCGMITPAEAYKMTGALSSILEDIENGVFKFDRTNEDVHTNIQNALGKKVGDLALKLHTARSRNDQVVFAAKMYTKEALSKIGIEIAALGVSLCSLGDKYRGLIIPGFTHMQHAQPVYLKNYLMAYINMTKRDDKRLEHICDNIKPTMGAGAMAGTPIKASCYGKFATANSIDAVSDRDFVIETLSALAILGMHLSRLAEDLIIWATKEFDFIEIDEAFCTGSSLMPQKKNPDALELIRGSAGRLYGNLVSVLVTMKGLPLSYNRDMQLDKEPLFDSLEIVSSELKIASRIVRTLRFNEEKVAGHLRDESLYATDIVYYLVDLGVPFAKAHTLVGELIKYSISSGIDVKKMPEDLLRKKLSPKVSKREIVKRFDPEFSVRSKRSIRRS
ncbi:MAG: argininosuccinate lyase [Candidatus Omnitrophota bacterium]